MTGIPADVHRWRIHARENLPDNDTWQVGEWRDGPLPTIDQAAREASEILGVPCQPPFNSTEHNPEVNT